MGRRSRVSWSAVTDERTYRLELQYDGGGLHGWAKQDGLPTVQGYLEGAFATVIGRVPELRVAGRTDAGVHARRQVVSVRLPRDLDRRRLLVSLNALTPPAIAVLGLMGAREDFDARRDAKSRTYRYQIAGGEAVSPFHRLYSWWIPARLDVGGMRDAGASVVGRHNFRAFTPIDTEHVFFERQVLRCHWISRRDGLLVLEIEADSFLRHMVRILVGTMVEVGLGRMSLGEWQSLLSGATRESAGPTAPARGLFLWDVRF